MDLLVKCPICMEQYSEERVPRILTCGHSLCTHCTGDTLNGVKTCPECHEKLFADDVIEIPVNFPLLRLIRALAEEKGGGEEVTETVVPAFPVDEPSTDQFSGVSNCDAHGSLMSFLCCTCSMWVCQDCLVVDHPVFPRGRCHILGISEAMAKIRSDHEICSNKILRVITNMKCNFDFETTIHEHCLQSCPAKQGGHRRLIKRIGSHLEKVERNNLIAVQKAKEFVENLTEEVNTTMSAKEITSLGQELVNFEVKLKRHTLKEKRRKMLVLQNVMEHLKLDLKILGKGKEPAHAILEVDEGCKWSRITIRDNRLLLYSLNEGKPPIPGINIPFEYARKMIPNERTTVFYEIGNEEEVLGRVYVRLQNSSALARQVVLMCSGETGVSYKGTCLYKYDKAHGILEGGDYENNDGSGGKAILEGTADCDSYSENWTSPGILTAVRCSTKFQFHLKRLKRNAHLVIGRVLEGLDVLQAAPDLQLGEVFVRDCGLFIPMNVDDDQQDETE